MKLRAKRGNAGSGTCCLKISNCSNCFNTRSQLTFTVCRGLRSPSERSLQVVVLLGQLL